MTALATRRPAAHAAERLTRHDGVRRLPAARRDLIAALAGRLEVEFKQRPRPARVLALPTTTCSSSARRADVRRALRAASTRPPRGRGRPRPA